MNSKRLRDETCPFCFKILFDRYSRDRHVRLLHQVIKEDHEVKGVKLASDKDENVELPLILEKNNVKIPFMVIKCDKCEKVFKHETSLKRHLKQHGEQSERFKCNECGSSFTRKDSVITHEAMVHGKFRINFSEMKTASSKENNFVCKMCEMSFGPDLNELKGHMALKVCQTKEKN